MTYVQIFGKESAGSYNFGLRILVDAPSGADLKSQEICMKVQEAADLIEDAILSSAAAADPKKQEARQIQRDHILGLFDQPIFVEEIPNGYCSQWCCRHLPWFVVTTRIGKITIGWRKRVISIDWSHSTVGASANQLFPNDDVTKSGQLIHAWSYEDARRYIQTVIESEDPVLASNPTD